MDNMLQKASDLIDLEKVLPRSGDDLPTFFELLGEFHEHIKTSITDMKKTLLKKNSK